MIQATATRRDILRTGVAGAAGLVAGGRRARAATPLRVLLNWLPETEHGGFFQAQATGLYEKAGLAVELMPGGPQINTMQLLAAGAADIALGYDMQVLSAQAQGLPLQGIAACFQSDLFGIMTRPDVTSLAGLRGHRIYVANNAYATYWPWLKQKFGYTDDMAAPKSVNLQAFFLTPGTAAAGYITSEPFVAQTRHEPVNFLLFSRDGWPAYGNPLVANRNFLAGNAAAVRPFLQATMQGWRSYLSDPRPGNALIIAANSRMDAAQLAFSLDRIRQTGVVNNGHARTAGIGVITEARWRATRDFMVGFGLLKPDTDWRAAFTTEYIDGVHVSL